MNLQHLSVFYEVARRGSISGAAGSLHVSQPSLSRTIRNLEEALNVRLFVRQARGVRLTEDGQRILERCHKIFAECEAIKNPEEAGVGNLRISASENLCIHIFPNLIRELNATSILLLSGTAAEVVRAAVNGEADVGYCYHSTKIPGVSSTLVATVEFWIVAGGTVPAKIPLRDLKKIPFIGSIEKQYSGPYAAKSLLSDAGLADVATSIQCNSQEGQLKMVEAGLGYSIVPWFVAKASVQSRKVVKVAGVKPLRVPLFKIRKLNSSAPLYDRVDDLVTAAVGGS